MKKKFLPALLAIVCVLCCALGLAACGVSGSYKLESITVTLNGKEYSAKAGESLDVSGDGSWMYPVYENNMTLKLNGDGTYTARVHLGDLGGNSDDEGTWEEVDGKVNLKKDDKITSTFTVDGNKLIMEMDGMKIVLKK